MARRAGEDTHDARLAVGETVNPFLTGINPLHDRALRLRCFHYAATNEVMQLVDFFLLSKHSSDAGASTHSSWSIGQAFYCKPGPTLDCHYRARRNSGTPDECSVAVLIDEIQCP